MGKTLVLGNKDRPSICIPNADFVQVPIYSLNEDGERKLNEVVSKAFCDDKGHNIDLDCIIIDVDSFPSLEYCLYLSLSIRLSPFEIGRAALAPIILLTGMTRAIMLGYQYSSVILTDKVYITGAENLNKVLGVVGPLKPYEYIDKFLNVINILPKANEGHHSIANQWGADVLRRVFLGKSLKNDVIGKARLSMYFRYVLVQTLNVDELEKVVCGSNEVTVSADHKKIDVKGKKVLLIDDEADKGWKSVLEEWLVDSKLEVIDKTAQDYESLPEGFRSKIEKGIYDLIFLDLRMNGSEEAPIDAKEFSGMRILKKIKDLNKGTQVIMLTASNKVWNMKALLDAGADGYYVKESPEYAFSFEDSKSNAEKLRETIEECFSKGYLREIWPKINDVKELIGKFDGDKKVKKWVRESIMGIDVAFDLLSQSNDENRYRDFAFLQFFLVVESYAKNSGVLEEDNDCFYMCRNDGVRQLIVDGNGYSEMLHYDENYKKYVVGEGHIFENKMRDTEFWVSVILICKFGEEDSTSYGWECIRKKRNNVSHPKGGKISIDDINKIIEFMKFFFDEGNANWRKI